MYRSRTAIAMIAYTSTRLKKKYKKIIYFIHSSVLNEFLYEKYGCFCDRCRTPKYTVTVSNAYICRAVRRPNIGYKNITYNFDF